MNTSNTSKLIKPARNKIVVYAALAVAGALMPNRSLADYQVNELNSTYHWTFYNYDSYGNPFSGFHAGILGGAANYAFNWAWDGSTYNDVIAGLGLDNLASYNHGWSQFGYNCGEAYNPYNSAGYAQPSVMFYGWANQPKPVEYYVVLVNPPASIPTVSPGTHTAYGYYRGTYWTTENNQTVHYDFFDQPMTNYTFWGYGPFDQYRVYRRPGATIGTSYSINLNAIFNQMNAFGMTRIGDPTQMADLRFCTETYGDSISGAVNASFWVE